MVLVLTSRNIRIGRRTLQRRGHSGSSYEGPRSFIRAIVRGKKIHRVSPCACRRCLARKAGHFYQSGQDPVPNYSDYPQVHADVSLVDNTTELAQPQVQDWTQNHLQGIDFAIPA